MSSQRCRMTERQPVRAESQAKRDERLSLTKKAKQQTFREDPESFGEQIFMTKEMSR